MIRRLLLACAIAAVVLYVVEGYLPRQKQVVQADPMPRANARPVPAALVHGLVTCLTEGTCRVPRQKIQDSWMVELAEPDIWAMFMTDGKTLKVMVITRVADGRQWPLLMEDVGTGTIAQITYADRDDQTMILAAGSTAFTYKYPLVQSIYYRLMEMAKKRIIPEAKMA